MAAKVLVFIVLVASFDLLLGYTGIVSFAHTMFFGIGAYGIAIVLINFALAAGAIALTARISLGLMMGAILVGYLVRLGLIFLAVYLVKDSSWISLPALGATIIVTHLGLLVWEMKYLAMSLAHPGLKPARS